MILLNSHTTRRSAICILLFITGILSFPSHSPAQGRDQVTDLNVWHRQGQTFITFREVNPPEVPNDVDALALKEMVQEQNRSSPIEYRIYCSSQPIASVKDLKPIASAKPLSCWNPEYYGTSPRKDQPAMRFVVKDGDTALCPGTGIYVHNPKANRGGHSGARNEDIPSYYAVTYCNTNRENMSIDHDNSTAQPVLESEGFGVPVLQRVVKPDEFSYIKNPELHYYVRWEAPPNAAVENKPIDYLVAIPPHIKKTPTPVGLHLHCWGGSLDGGYGWWYSHQQVGSTCLISSNQIPYDWWTGYHEKYFTDRWTQKDWADGVVRPYSTTRMLSFLDWAAKKYDLDLNRVFAAGSSMGGSGAPMFALRHSDRIAWAVGWVGVHDPGNTPQFTGSYEQVYGKKEWGIKFQDQTPVFEYYNDVAYLRKYPQKDVGFITWSNGKNDSGIGWPQAVEFCRAMQETRRPHIFVWGMGGHGQRAVMPADAPERVMPLDIRLTQSLPAFTSCSLDDDPGTARKLQTPIDVPHEQETVKDHYDGDPAGQINRYLVWRTDDIIDTPSRWEITVSLIPSAPAGDCTVDITPRRLQQLKPKPDESFRWQNKAGENVVQSGTTTVDQWGLITIKKVIVTKHGNRIVVNKSSS